MVLCGEYLEGDELIVDNDVLREKVRPDGRLVLRGESLVHVLVHQRRFPHAESRGKDQDNGVTAQIDHTADEISRY